MYPSMALLALLRSKDFIARIERVGLDGEACGRDEGADGGMGDCVSGSFEADGVCGDSGNDGSAVITGAGVGIVGSKEDFGSLCEKSYTPASNCCSAQGGGLSGVVGMVSL